jgi:hypothetical protein
MVSYSLQEDTAMKKQGDVSRKRRLLGSEAKCCWYAKRRAERFAARYWACA